MSKVIMIQGTMSNAGKSLVCAGLCRIFAQDGFRAAPFKSQNMALNSYVTNEGLEIGRAQAMQAQAAKMNPLVCMNPILLKPTTDVGSQVIVNGEIIGNMSAREYFEYKKSLVPEIINAFKTLENIADIIVVEGAGSPAEINLKENDIVNMGLAELLGAPVLLVSDIDRGGVFAQLLGTIMLLEKEEQDRIKGFVINKFRGDKTLLDSGIKKIEERTNKPVLGLIPYMDIALPDEDSLTERFNNKKNNLKKEAVIDIAIIKLPKISNFTDFDVFEQYENVSVRYVDKASEINNPDMIILPGSKNTISDLLFIRENGFEKIIKEKAKDTLIFGICGGMQMLGNEISDPGCIETGGNVKGMELLPVKTVLSDKKIRTVKSETLSDISGILEPLNGKKVHGYEIHVGRTKLVYTNSACQSTPIIYSQGNVYGTYIHGFFDEDGISNTIIQILSQKKGIACNDNVAMSYANFLETQYDMLADELRKRLNMEYIYSILSEARI